MFKRNNLIICEFQMTSFDANISKEFEFNSNEVTTYNLFCCAEIRQTTHTNDNLCTFGQQRLGLIGCTAGHINEIFASGSVHFDVTIADVMFVPFQCHISMFLGHKTN